MQTKQINSKQTNKRKTYTQILQNTHFFWGFLFLIEPLGVTNEPDVCKTTAVNAACLNAIARSQTIVKNIIL